MAESTDATLEILRRNGVAFRSHDYQNHCQTYDQITALATRALSENLTWRDRLRVYFPFTFLAPAFISFVLRRGFLDGRGGVVYALDRLIAEAIQYRLVVARRGQKDRSTAPRT